jgi:hypothetical protein
LQINIFRCDSNRPVNWYFYHTLWILERPTAALIIHKPERVENQSFKIIAIQRMPQNRRRRNKISVTVEYLWGFAY